MDHPGDELSDVIDARTSLQDIAAYCGSIENCSSFKHAEGYGGFLKSRSVPMANVAGVCFYVKQTGLCSFALYTVGIRLRMLPNASSLSSWQGIIATDFKRMTRQTSSDLNVVPVLWLLMRPA